MGYWNVLEIYWNINIQYSLAFGSVFGLYHKAIFGYIKSVKWRNEKAVLQIVVIIMCRFITSPLLHCHIVEHRLSNLSKRSSKASETPQIHTLTNWFQQCYVHRMAKNRSESIAQSRSEHIKVRERPPPNVDKWILKQKATGRDNTFQQSEVSSPLFECKIFHTQMHKGKCWFKHQRFQPMATKREISFNRRARVYTFVKVLSC